MPTGNPRLPESYVADRRKKRWYYFMGIWPIKRRLHFLDDQVRVSLDWFCWEHLNRFYNGFYHG